MFKNVTMLISILILLVGCSNIRHREFPNCSYFSNTDICKDEGARKIAIFFDGTGNSEESNTNVSKLYNLVNLQGVNSSDDKLIHSLYVAGVGTDKIISGNLFGKGIDDRVKIAYHFIAKNYQQQRMDQIYLFGFSRGSYSARMLAGLIYVAELPNLKSIECEDLNSDKCKKSEMKLINKIYSKYKSKDSALEKKNSIKSIEGYEPISVNTRINYMGIFDTVAALSYDPNKEEQTGILSKIHVDQICNIDKVSHAMSLDDNRKTTFPPLPMSVKNIASTCDGVKSDDEIEELIRGVLTEVWFSGAHSDIGGGYADSDLSGVTLNWMIRQIKSTPEISGLLPDNSFVYEDINAESHIGEDSILKGKIYLNHNRRIDKIVEKYHGNLKNKPVIHSSVFQRRREIPRVCREFDFTKSADSNKGNCYKKRTTLNAGYIYEKCFDKNYILKEGIPDLNRRAKFTLELKPEQQCFDISEPELYKYIE